MEVPIQDLLSPTPPSRTSPRNKRPISSHPHTSRIDADSEVASSMRVSVLSRNLASRHGGTKDSTSVHSSASSTRSASSTTSSSSAASTSSAASDSTVGKFSRTDTINTAMSPARRLVQATRARDAAAAAAISKERPDSKLTPDTLPISSQDTSSISLSPQVDDSKGVSETGAAPGDAVSTAVLDAPAESVRSSPLPTKKVVITRASLASMSSRSPGSPSPSSRNVKATSAASIRSQAASTAARKSAASRQSGVSSRPVSRSSTQTSSASTLSRVSTARSSTATNTASTTTSSVSRPASAVSTASSSTTSSVHPHRVSTMTIESAKTYKTASSRFSSTSPQPRSRKSSVASTSSARTAGQPPITTSGGRIRKVSGASVHSVSSTAGSAYGSVKSSGSRTQRQAPPPPVPPIDPTKLSPSSASTRSTVSVRSVRSTTSIKKTPTVPRSNRTSAVDRSPRISPASSMPVSPVELRASSAEENKENEGNSDEGEISSSTTIKAGMLVESDTNMEHKKSDSTVSTGSNATIKKKKSNETIVTPDVATTNMSSTSRSSGDGDGDGLPDRSTLLDKPQPPLPTVQVELDKPQQPNVNAPPRGVALEIGIPCIVSCKRKRFKAYARYIGEVQGEYGPWVGVEVPIPLGESWTDRDLDLGWQGTQWNDGTWDGIRYFDIGNGMMYGGHRRGAVDWEYSYDDKATRKKGAGLVDKMKRVRSASPAVSDASGSESRGLFVRPQQILYVVDAVEDL